ncbi:glutaredoxin family protein [Microlunatus speluncae]|uniref:glutaredoxin family protein n=1 Tax=Microlunatus speluncae TaxID=2594267 RepID=UPI001266195C|nr:glutaredoxin family protein [Microlunatus speluncae]
MTEQPRVTILVRQNCHLCDEALEVVRAVCAETGDQWATTDVDSDPDLVRRYTDQVPVTFVDGAQHDFWRVDAHRLRMALAG